MAKHLGYCEQQVELGNGDATDCGREAVLLSDDGARFCERCLELSKLQQSEIGEVTDIGREAMKRMWTSLAREAARRFVADPSDAHREVLRVAVDNAAIYAGDYSASRKRVA